MEEKNTKEKLSYEQLVEICNQLETKYKQLVQQYMQVQQNQIFMRLDFLFKVVENSNNFSVEFANKCVSEIENLLTIPETNSENNKEKSNE